MMVLLIGRWIVFDDWTYVSRVPRKAVWRTSETLAKV